jgi:hypothetical protein
MALLHRPLLVALAAIGCLAMPAFAEVQIAPPPAQGEVGRGSTGSPAQGENALTPPQSALNLLQQTLKDHGRKSGFDHDYGTINRTLLARLADAIDMVESGPRPARQGSRIEPVMTTWRTMNRDFVAQLTRDAATLKSLAEQPIRYRLAEQNLYERIVLALRKNVACLRDMTAAWTSQADMPTAGNPG